jgi:putative membrane protein
MVKANTQTSSIPAWLTGRLTRDDLAQVATAVRQVEVTTNGEIVPMIVRRSASVGHVFPMIALILWLLALLVDAPKAAMETLPAGWLGDWPTSEMQMAAMATVFVLLAFVALALSRIPLLERLFTGPFDLAAQVDQRAALEFHLAGLTKTQEATGILLFLSLAERRAVVLADKTIAAKLPPETWNDVLALITRGAKSGRLAPGLVDAVKRCGELVAPHFPPRPHDVNELNDALVIKE